MKRWIHWMAALATAGLLAACGGGSDNESSATEQRSLAQALGSEPEASEFMKLVDASGLTEQLQSDPSLTVLAPSNQAMADMGSELAELRKPENQAALREFVASHLIAQAMQADDMKTGRQTTVSGAQLEIERASANGVSVNGVALSSGGSSASNGVYFVIRAPLWRPSALLYLKLFPQFSILSQAVKAAGLESAFTGSQPFTLLAPTNTAFAALLTELNLTADQLLANKPLLTEVLKYHVLPSRVSAVQIRDGATAVTVQGQALSFEVKRRAGPDIVATDARGRMAGVILPTLFARNGVVHVVDKVVLPQNQNL